MSEKKEKESSAGKELQVHASRPQPLSPFEEMESLFDEFLARGGWMEPFWRRGLPEFESASRGRFPKVDIIDRDQEIVIKAELPGVAKDGLDVSISENVLTIRASTRQEKKEEKEHYYRRELSRGEFQRAIRLPGQVESDKAKASFKDGILEIQLPKAPGSKRQSVKVE